MKYVAMMALVPETEADDVEMPNEAIQVIQDMDEADVNEQTLGELIPKLIEAFKAKGPPHSNADS